MPLKIAIFGASGYTGAEAIRIALGHPDVEIVALTGESKAGKSIDEVYPHLTGYGLPSLVRIEDVSLTGLDAVFLCLPHATTQKVAKTLRAAAPDLRLIDLSADFRLRDVAAYESWYGEHFAPEHQNDAVYGLTEHYRSDIKDAPIIACPGCYPTSILVPLLALQNAGLIDPSRIIADSKSGTTGAGRKSSEALSHSEVSEGFHAYGVASHRHTAELDQELSLRAGTAVKASFTPHLLPMNRGILSTVYGELAPGATIDEAQAVLRDFAEREAFVVQAQGATPVATRFVRSTNRVLVDLKADRRDGSFILLSAIDNLTKGSSGQAFQNFNVAFGLEETTGLHLVSAFP
jgi:N-acetyl-gamma-glutamyl-phosphate reductase